jgi:hypothetical protein
VGGDLLHLVDEDDDAVEVLDACEELAQRARAPVGIDAGELAREHLDERPAEAPGDRLGERRLARSGRPEEDHRRGRDHAVATCLVPLGERKDHAPLDQLLLALHAADRRPQLAGRPAPAELLEPVVRDGRVESPLLEVPHAVPEDVARRLRGRDRRLAVCRQHRDLAHAERLQAALERPEEIGADASPAELCRDRPAEHPGSLAVHAGRDRADDGLARRSDERRLPRRDGGEHLGKRERRLVVALRVALPQAHGLLEPRVVELADLHAAGGVPDRRLHPQRLATRSCRPSRCM